MKQYSVRLMMLLLACTAMTGCTLIDILFEQEDPRAEAYSIAKRAYAEQQLDEAEVNYLFCTRADLDKSPKPDLMKVSSAPYCALSRLYFLQGRYADAVEARLICGEIEKRLSYDRLSNLSEHLHQLARIYFAWGKYDEGFECLQIVLEICTVIVFT